MGCCLLVLILAGAPRVATLFWWFYRPSTFANLFSSWLIPVLGILILPWTTLAWVLLNGKPGTFGWFILIFAFLLDLSTHGGSGVANRRRRSN